MKDMLEYAGKCVVVTGAASGMGAATARILHELGAKVYALDINEIVVPTEKSIKTDLMERESIDDAVDQMPSHIDALFNCAGCPSPPFPYIDSVLINFVGHRYLTECLLPRMSGGGAIVFVSSLGGKDWAKNYNLVAELLRTEGFDDARRWLEENPDALPKGHPGKWYGFSKECITAYVKERAKELAKRSIRINSLSPGPTDTAMMPLFIEGYGKKVMDYMLPPVGRQGTAEEMAEPLVFLNSHMARFISGHDLIVDFGWAATTEMAIVKR